MGDGVNAFWERVPVASVLALAPARVGTHSGTHAHFDPIDHAKLRALEIQACGVCADRERDCHHYGQWICRERFGGKVDKEIIMRFN